MGNQDYATGSSDSNQHHCQSLLVRAREGNGDPLHAI
jgi:hypothetical protein